jgi:two-component system, oxyanion-binding sensor
VFFRNAANYPWRSHAQWLMRQMARWGYLDDHADIVVAAAIFRSDLYAEAARSLGLAVPNATSKSEGRHGGQWSLAATPAAIEMGPDLFLDGAVFDPSA